MNAKTLFKLLLLGLTLSLFLLGSLDADAARKRRGNDAEQKKEAIYPDATRAEPKLKQVPRLQRDLNKLITANNEDKYDEVIKLGEQLVANKSAGSYALVGGDHAGENALIEVEIISVKERELPEADDDFAELASEFDTLAELRESLAGQAAENKKVQSALGARDLRKMFRHILPTALGPLSVQASLGVGYAILSLAGLSFLGLGVQPPAADWGEMLNRGRNFLPDSNWLLVFPGLAISVTVLAFNLLGDGLRDALDPRD